jgi:hypothetical protein
VRKDCGDVCKQKDPSHRPYCFWSRVLKLAGPNFYTQKKEVNYITRLPPANDSLDTPPLAPGNNNSMTRSSSATIAQMCIYMTILLNAHGLNMPPANDNLDGAPQTPPAHDNSTLFHIPADLILKSSRIVISTFQTRSYCGLRFEIVRTMSFAVCQFNNLENRQTIPNHGSGPYGITIDRR